MYTSAAGVQVDSACWCRTVAVDLRGFGESDKPRCMSDYTLDELTEDIDQLVTALRVHSHFT